MLSLHPRHMHGDIMNKTSFPRPKRWHNLLRNGFIALLPNMPRCQDDHFKEKRLVKPQTGLLENHFKIRAIFPLHLKVIPYSQAKIAMEKRCTQSSMICNGHNTQCTESVMFQCLLLSMSLVFKRSLTINQANTLIRSMTRLFHIQA